MLLRIPDRLLVQCVAKVGRAVRVAVAVYSMLEECLL
jgi:hypothetical protein